MRLEANNARPLSIRGLAVKAFAKSTMAATSSGWRYPLRYFAKGLPVEGLKACEVIEEDIPIRKRAADEAAGIHRAASRSWMIWRKRILCDGGWRTRPWKAGRLCGHSGAGRRSGRCGRRFKPTVEDGWIDIEHQVGVTGKRIHPKLISPAEFPVPEHSIRWA